MRKATTKYILKRFLIMIPMILVISLVIFLGLQLTPGNPLTYQIPPDQLLEESFDLEAYEEKMGLNDPLLIQYLRWMKNIATGQLGYSLTSGAPIINMLRTRLPASLELNFAAFIMSLVIGITFGMLAAVRQNSIVDYLCTGFSVLVTALPSFFMGIIFISVFALRLGWLPTGGRVVYGDSSLSTRIAHMILPALVLGLHMIGALMRHTRSAMLDTMNMDYIKTARSKGIPEAKVYFKHGFRNALIPVSVMLCFRVAGLIGGSVVIEKIFAWPGLGTMMLDAISGKDYPVVMITTMIMAVMTLIASFMADVMTALLDTRVNLNK